MNTAERTKRAPDTANRQHHPNDPQTGRPPANIEADPVAQHIQRLVDEAPPLSAEQRSRLALLLRGADVTR